MELTPPTIRDGPDDESTSWAKEGRPQSEDAVPVNVFMLVFTGMFPSQEHVVKFLPKLELVSRRYTRHEMSANPTLVISTRGGEPFKRTASLSLPRPIRTRSHHSPPRRCRPGSRQRRRTWRSSSGGSGRSDTRTLLESRLFLGSRGLGFLSARGQRSKRPQMDKVLPRVQLSSSLPSPQSSSPLHTKRGCRGLLPPQGAVGLAVGQTGRACR